MGLIGQKFSKQTTTISLQKVQLYNREICAYEDCLAKWKPEGQAPGCLFSNPRSKRDWPEFNKEIYFSLQKNVCKHPHTCT